jgi:hypothetical protein
VGVNIPVSNLPSVVDCIASAKSMSAGLKIISAENEITNHQKREDKIWNGNGMQY